MHIVIVGNGVLGLTAAFRLLARDSQLTISIVGPEHHRGCASLAAAAMFNSFCEADTRTLTNPIEHARFLFNHSAIRKWPDFINEIQTRSGLTVNHGFGTFLINNHATDELEDESFEAVIETLNVFSEPYQTVVPRDIPHYNPAPHTRAARAIYIPSEGWINPLQLLAALKESLRLSNRVEFFDDTCTSLRHSGSQIVGAQLGQGHILRGEIYLVANGASFSQLMESSRITLDVPKIFYGVGCSLLLKTDQHTLTNCVRTPNRGGACGVYSAPQTATHTLIGASNFISPEPEDGPRLTSIHTLLGAAMNQINTAFYKAPLVKVNTGWRPTSEDTLPLIGTTSLSNLLIATGTKRDGLHCSPVICECLSDLALTGSTSIDIGLFRPERKPVRLYTRAESIETVAKHALNAAYQHGFQPSTSRMVEDLHQHYLADITALHDQVGTQDWGIPPELVNMYRYGHVRDTLTQQRKAS